MLTIRPHLLPDVLDPEESKIRAAYNTVLLNKAMDVSCGKCLDTTGMDVSYTFFDGVDLNKIHIPTGEFLIRHKICMKKPLKRRGLKGRTRYTRVYL